VHLSTAWFTGYFFQADEWAGVLAGRACSLSLLSSWFTNGRSSFSFGGMLEYGRHGTSRR
jgi:hypothetical protein